MEGSYGLHQLDGPARDVARARREARELDADTLGPVGRVPAGPMDRGAKIGVRSGLGGLDREADYTSVLDVKPSSAALFKKLGSLAQPCGVLPEPDVSGRAGRKGLVDQRRTRDLCG